MLIKFFYYTTNIINTSEYFNDFEPAGVIRRFKHHYPTGAVDRRIKLDEFSF